MVLSSLVVIHILSMLRNGIFLPLKHPQSISISDVSISTVPPVSFDNIFDKLDNFFHSDGGPKEINVPEEEFLENQYLQDYYEEDEKYLERPEAQQFYKD